MIQVLYMVHIGHDYYPEQALDNCVAAFIGEDAYERARAVVDAYSPKGGQWAEITCITVEDTPCWGTVACFYCPYPNEGVWNDVEL